MGVLDVISTLAAVAAVVVSVVSLNRTRRLEQQQAKLADKQLEQIEADEHQAERAKIDVELLGHGTNRQLRVANFGQSDARDIEIEWVGTPLPFPENEERTKLPIERLKPFNAIEIVVAFGLDSARKYEGVVSWTNPNGEPASDEFTIHF